MKEKGLDIGGWSTPESMRTWSQLSIGIQETQSGRHLLEHLREIVVGKFRKVLDVGCGNGRFIPPLASPDGLYVGVDNSPLIAEAGHKYPYIPQRQEYFRRDITEGLEFLRNRQFNFITMLFCLHFIEEYKIMPLIDGLSNRLEANGQMIFVGYVDNPEFNEYVEHCISNVSAQVKKNLFGGYVLIQGTKK